MIEYLIQLHYPCVGEFLQETRCGFQAKRCVHGP
jgi:hypothetical protein